MRDESKGLPPSGPARPSGPVRRYDDDEIRRVLGKAAELQERSVSVARDGERGLTLDELRAVAREAGIDPRFVDLAASDVDAPVERRGNAWAGAPFRWSFETELEGEIADEARERIVQLVRGEFGNRGELADVFGRMEWSYDDGLGPVIVGVASRSGRTAIQVTVVRSSEVGLLHGLGTPAGGMVGAALAKGVIGLSGPVLLPLFLGAGAATYGATWLLWRKRSVWWERRLRRLAERISGIVQGSVGVRQESEEKRDYPS